MCFSLSYSNNKKLIHFIDCLFNENGTKILRIKNRNIEVNSNPNEIKTFAFVSSYLLVSSSFRNKVHLYNIETGEFKYCLTLGNFPYEI